MPISLDFWPLSTRSTVRVSDHILSFTGGPLRNLWSFGPPCGSMQESYPRKSLRQLWMILANSPGPNGFPGRDSILPRTFLDSETKGSPSSHALRDENVRACSITISTGKLCVWHMVYVRQEYE